jgi:hypothetical protein
MGHSELLSFSWPAARPASRFTFGLLDERPGWRSAQAVFGQDSIDV